MFREVAVHENTPTPTPSTLHSILLLHRAQLHSDNQLGLGRHVLEDVSLQPSQHVRPQQIVELLDLVLLGNVSKLFQETLKITAERERDWLRDWPNLSLGDKSIRLYW